MVDAVERRLDYAATKSAAPFILLARTLRSTPFSSSSVALVYFLKVSETRPDVLCSDFVVPLMGEFAYRAEWQMCLDVCSRSFLLNSHAPTPVEVSTLLASAAFLGSWQDVLFHAMRYVGEKSHVDPMACIAAAQLGLWEKCLVYLQEGGGQGTLHTAAVEHTALCCIREGVVRPDTMALLNRAIHWVL